MELKLSQLRPIIRALHDRGYKKTPIGNYRTTFQFSDVPNLTVCHEVTILQLALYPEGHDELLYKIYVECMNKLAAEETRMRLGRN